MEGNSVGVVEGLSQGVVGELALLEVQETLDLLVELVGWTTVLAFCTLLFARAGRHLLVYLVLVMTSPRSSVK